MKKEDNVLRKWWFNFVFVPLVFGAFALPSFLLHNLDPNFKSDSFLYVWFIVLAVALIIETFILFKRKVVHKGEHYMFIAASVLFAIVFGFMIHKIIDWTMGGYSWEWTEGIYLLVSPLLLVIFKTILWAMLHKKAKRAKKKTQKIKNLKEKVEELEEEIAD